MVLSKTNLRAASARIPSSANRLRRARWSIDFIGKSPAKFTPHTSQSTLCAPLSNALLSLSLALAIPVRCSHITTSDSSGKFMKHQAWGKANREQDDAIHPLAHHSMDVAATSCEWLNSRLSATAWTPLPDHR